MEEIITLLYNWGPVGLFVAAFTESFCSPVLPDIFLIPLAMAQPEKAIYYGCSIKLPADKPINQS